jgi:outer membrane protein OmpA-like peptidoglycan-associated protein
LFAGCLLPQSGFAQNVFPSEKFEISPFAGATLFRDTHSGVGTDLSTGPTIGFRVTEDVLKHFGVEETFDWTFNDLRFLTPYTTPNYSNTTLDNRQFRFSADGLFYFTAPGSRFRPFLEVGFGGVRNKLTGAASNLLTTQFLPPGQTPTANEALQFNYGGGLKIRFSNLFGLRFDARGLDAHAPNYGLSTSNNGGVYLPDMGRLNSFEFTGGLVFNINGHAPDVCTVTSISQDPASSGVESEGIVVGNPVTFKADVQNPKKWTLKFQWRVDGQPAGTDSDTFVYTPSTPGAHKVDLTVTEVGGKARMCGAGAGGAGGAASLTKTVYAKRGTEHRLTVGQIMVDPPSAARGVPGALQGSMKGLNPSNSDATGSAVRLSVEASDSLGHRLDYVWLVNGTQVGTGNPFAYTPEAPGWYRVEVRVTDTAPNPAIASNPSAITIYARDIRPPTATCAAVDPALTFGQSTDLRVAAFVPQGHTARIRWALSEGSVTDPAAAQTTFNSSTVNFAPNPQVQTKAITATATVTDDYDRSVSCNVVIRVSTDPGDLHYADILFGPGSSRVDNAAKRVLIDRLYPDLTGPYQGYTLVLVGHIDASERANRVLDRNRVRNAAAVLTAKPLPPPGNSCTALELSRIKADWIGTTDSEYKDASSLASTSGSRINRDDPRSRNRRVEIWLVPPGKPMPSVVKDPRSLDARDIRVLGCPR